MQGHFRGLSSVPGNSVTYPVTASPVSNQPGLPPELGFTAVPKLARGISALYLNELAGSKGA